MSETITGRCGCGEALYSLERAPILVANCHCTLCQRQTGAPSALNAFVEGDAIHLTEGTTSQHAMAAGSGGVQTVVRCASCGTALWSHYPGLGTLLVMVRVPTLDDPARFPPDVVIHADDALPWSVFPKGVTVFTGALVARDVLPPEKLDRMRALAARRKAGEG
jgi:hypothetical protein